MDPVIVHSYPDEWVSRYVDNRYAEIDPVITQGRLKSTPFIWSDLFGLGPDLEKERYYLAEASAFELNDGLGIPVYDADRSYSILSIASDDPSASIVKYIEESKLQLISIAFAYHCLARQHVWEKASTVTHALTKREKECLLWVARGKSSWEIASIIKVSERTVIFHIENAKTKLDVTNRSHAAVKAMVQGLISP